MMTKLDNIDITRTDNGWVVRINGSDECGEWVDETMVVVCTDHPSRPILAFLEDYIALPRRK